MTDSSETAQMLSDAKLKFHGFEDKKEKVTRNVIKQSFSLREKPRNHKTEYEGNKYSRCE